MALECDVYEVQRFVEILFKHADEDTFVSLRAFRDDIDGFWRPSDWPVVKLNGAGHSELVTTAHDFARLCANADETVVFASPIATFHNANSATESDLANGLVLSVDLDRCPEAGRKALEEVLGQATLVIASGGSCIDPNTGEIEQTLHCHWRLTAPTRTAIEHDFLKECRNLAARIANADPTTKSIVHPLRWPGSWHRKSAPRLCRILVCNPDSEITIAEALLELRAAVENKTTPRPNGHDSPATAYPDDLTRKETAELVTAVLQASEYHEPITKLAIRFLMGGMADATAVETLQGIMLAVDPGRRDFKNGLLVKGRWENRYHDIARAVATARAKLDENAPVPETPKPEVTLGQAAYHGLAGDIVAAILPHTESDPVAVLVQFLAAFGNAVGRHAYVLVEATRHYPNLFVTIVGKTAKTRKGTSWRRVRQLFEDNLWTRDSIVSGLSTGEGLIFHVRDPAREIHTDKKTGERTTVITDQGVDDKRLLVIEEEFARPLRAMKRSENTLSTICRNAWDGIDLRTMTRKSPLRATAPHISIIAHVTEEELLVELDDTSIQNGFCNRFIFITARRSKLLPFGGNLDDAVVAELSARTTTAISACTGLGRVRMDILARQLWRELYPTLTAERLGLGGAITARGDTHVIRLALLYALLDQAEAIGLAHLNAALELWKYAESSTLAIFGDKTGDRIADTILSVLRMAGASGRTRGDFTKMFSHATPANQIDRALQKLLDHKLVKFRTVATAGRTATVWSI